MARRVTTDILNLRPADAIDIPNPTGLGKHIYRNAAGELKERNAAGEDSDLGGTGSNIAPSTRNANQITFDSDGKPIIALSDNTGKAVEYNGIPLYVPLEAVAGLMGVDLFEQMVLGESIAVPIYDYGDRVIVGNKIFKKIQDPNNALGDFLYIMTKAMKVSLSGLVLAGLTNASTAQKRVGTILPISNTFQWAGDRVVTITVTANNPLKDVLISLGFSGTRSQTKYWVEWLIPSSNTTNTFTCKVRVFVEGDGTVLRFEQVDSATAPTKYPASRKLDANVMSGMEMPVFAKFNSTAAPAVTITGFDAVLELAEPAREPFLSTVKYKEASKHPFHHDDPLCNMAFGDKAYTGKVVNTHNWAATGSNTTGTISASGTAGSDVVTVTRTANLKAGYYPSITDFYGSADSDFEGHNNYGKSTAETFGAGSKILAVLSSTQIQMSRPLLQNLSLRGKESFGAIHGLQFFSNSKTLMARQGWVTVDDTQTNQFTGIRNTSSPQATDRIVTLPIMYIKPTDPIKQWDVGYIISWTSWIFGKPDTTDTLFGERFQNFSFFMRTPVALNTASIVNGDNPDENLCLIPPSGDVIIESYKTSYNSTTGVYRGGRMMCIDPNKKGCSYILDRPELLLDGRSNTTRAIGVGGLISGVIRDWEYRLFPDSTRTDESEADIDANIELSMSIIQHGLTMTMDITQSKSRRYCPDATDQTVKLPYYCYISQFDQHRPNIAVAGSGYALWDVVYVEGGDFVEPLALTVTAVGAGGSIADWFVSDTGQYRTIPSGTTFSTNSSGAGTGAQVSVTGLPDSTVVSAATAFPVWAKQSVMQYPAENIDSNAPTEYSGTISPGQKFRLSPLANLRAIWKQRRLTDPTNPTSSYFLLGVCAAGQNFGFVWNDVAYQTHYLMVMEASLRNTPAYTILNTQSVRRFFKSRLFAVENINKINNGGTPIVDAPVLRPATNPIATLTSADRLLLD